MFSKITAETTCFSSNTPRQVCANICSNQGTELTDKKHLTICRTDCMLLTHLDLIQAAAPKQPTAVATRLLLQAYQQHGLLPIINHIGSPGQAESSNIAPTALLSGWSQHGTSLDCWHISCRTAKVR